MEVKYYVCSHCGNIIEMVKDEGVPIMCCGTVMKGLRPGMTDASAEKHVPVCTVQGEHVHVSVGAAPHPMEKEHYIEWITLVTDQGIYRKKLAPGEDPAADFYLAGGEKVKETYAYCNLHALWISEM